MGFIELGLIAIGLSMDACAVSISQGLGMKRLNYRQAVVIALFFGVFQAGMPVIGWLLGVQFQSYIVSIDHWIAFILLALIGGKMLFDGIRGEESEEGVEETPTKLDIKKLFLLAIATSIDALAVGITFAFLQVNIVLAVLLIGVVTFGFSFAGVIVGNKVGARYERPATIAGGVVLIGIGFKILLEHLEFLG